MSSRFTLALLAGVSLTACGEDDAKTDTLPPANLLCPTPTAVACEDAEILELNLQADPAPGLITNERAGAEWHTHVDARAGGAFTSTPHSFVYASFTDSGLVKVPIGDEVAFTNMSWDIAFRRYIIRVNSGDSGPSCVRGARLADGTTLESVAAAPAGAPYRVDDYFTDSCDVITDGSGLGSPATALSGFWTYPGCVQMTDLVYVLELASGRHVKLVVTHYYDAGAQAECQSTDASSSSGSGNIRLRWALLD